MSISPPKVELGGLKDWHIQSIVIQGNSKLHSILNATLPKIRALNKSYSKLNFVQKIVREHMSISPESGGKGLEKLIWLKYDIVRKWQNTFNLGLNIAKNMHHTKRSVK